MYGEGKGVVEWKGVYICEVVRYRLCWGEGREGEE
jgi:hypothetical protein